MYRRNFLKYFSLVLGLALSFAKAGAQPYSYIYIQADKNLQFNIKVNGQMLPQYGKTYAIIPKLLPGPVNVYFLFPGNAYPPQRFIIEVPENGFRTFLLTVYDGAIALYDMPSRSYAHGETVTEQQMNADVKGKIAVGTQDINKKITNDSAGLITGIADSSLIIKKPEAIIADKPKEKVMNTDFAEDYNKLAAKKEESFIKPKGETGKLDTSAFADEYNNSPTIKDAVIAKTPKKENIARVKDGTGKLDTSAFADDYNTPPIKKALIAKAQKKDTTSIEDIFREASKKAKVEAGKPPVADPISLPDYWALHPSEKPAVIKDNKTNKTSIAVKGKCGEPIGEKAYDDIYIKSLQKNDNDRLKFLLGNLHNCFSSSQVRVLATTLATDPERYAFLKQAYPRVTDKANFAGLESILSKREWKDYFELLLQ